MEKEIRNEKKKIDDSVSRHPMHLGNVYDAG
jgi:hypothetical protein